jgi:serine/threonine-protein kinase
VLERSVAIKILRSDCEVNDDMKDLFLQEANAIASLEHPNIVKVFDRGRDLGVDYFVMEYVPGGNLAQFIAGHEGSFTEDEALHFIIQIAQALTHAHKNNVVHRDIKPHNILVDENQHCYLTDFGIATKDGDTTSVELDMIMGTPQYLSPEQAQGMEAATTSDIYSLGIIFYELLSGLPPFTIGKGLEIAVQHINDTPVAIRATRADVRYETAQILDKMLAKDPDERYQDGDKLLLALDELTLPLNIITPNIEPPLAMTQDEVFTMQASVEDLPA